jgi:hypothetical protein
MTTTSRVPQECPCCSTYGWITLVLRAHLEGITSTWRCMKCLHQWSILQSWRARLDEPVRTIRLTRSRLTP